MLKSAKVKQLFLAYIPVTERRKNGTGGLNEQYLMVLRKSPGDVMSPSPGEILPRFIGRNNDIMPHLYGLPLPGRDVVCLAKEFFKWVFYYFPKNP